MIKINLRHYYPHYSSDVFIEVPDDIAIELHLFESEDASFRMRKAGIAHFTLWIAKTDLSGKCSIVLYPMRMAFFGII